MSTTRTAGTGGLRPGQSARRGGAKAAPSYCNRTSRGRTSSELPVAVDDRRLPRQQPPTTRRRSWRRRSATLMLFTAFTWAAAEPASLQLQEKEPFPNNHNQLPHTWPIHTFFAFLFCLLAGLRIASLQSCQVAGCMFSMTSRVNTKKECFTAMTFPLPTGCSPVRRDQGISPRQARVSLLKEAPGWTDRGSVTKVLIALESFLMASLISGVENTTPPRGSLAKAAKRVTWSPPHRPP